MHVKNPHIFSYDYYKTTYGLYIELYFILIDCSEVMLRLCFFNPLSRAKKLKITSEIKILFGNMPTHHGIYIIIIYIFIARCHASL